MPSRESQNHLEMGWKSTVLNTGSNGAWSIRASNSDKEEVMEQYSAVGKRLPRVDGAFKVTGSAKYSVDIVLPSMLSGKILRSHYPHARILNIDTSKALKLPGVRAVITGKETSGVKFSMVDIPVTMRPHDDQFRA